MALLHRRGHRRQRPPAARRGAARRLPGPGSRPAAALLPAGRGPHRPYRPRRRARRPLGKSLRLDRRRLSPGQHQSHGPHAGRSLAVARLRPGRPRAARLLHAAGAGHAAVHLRRRPPVVARRPHPAAAGCGSGRLPAAIQLSPRRRQQRRPDHFPVQPGPRPIDTLLASPATRPARPPRRAATGRPGPDRRPGGTEQERRRLIIGLQSGLSDRAGPARRPAPADPVGGAVRRRARRAHRRPALAAQSGPLWRLDGRRAVHRHRRRRPRLQPGASAGRKRRPDRLVRGRLRLVQPAAAVVGLLGLGRHRRTGAQRRPHLHRPSLSPPTSDHS